MISPRRLYEKLLLKYGFQGWWPVSDNSGKPASYRSRRSLSEDQKLEVCVGAILAQNTAWSNAARAIESLREKNLLNLDSLSVVSLPRLSKAIKSAGFFNQKAVRLKLFAKFVLKHHGSLGNFFLRPLDSVRSDLLALKGIGPETCDSMLLYAGNFPVFVVDAYTRRFVKRFYGLGLDYSACQNFFASKLGLDPRVVSEYHALLVAHSKYVCRANPLCENCFLKSNCRFFKSLPAKGKFSISALTAVKRV